MVGHQNCGPAFKSIPISASSSSSNGETENGPNPSEKPPAEVFELPSEGTDPKFDSKQPLLTPPQPSSFCTMGWITGCNLANQIYTEGKSGGISTTDWYDNRDDNHAQFDPAYIPAIQRMSTGRGYCSGEPIVGKVTVGNASLAFVYGDAWMSLARSLTFTPSVADVLYRQYMGNTLYLYPEHNDHDDKDQYHSNWPFTFSSQGSSGSELDEVSTFFLMLASFKPDTRKKLESLKLLIPTLQMLQRRFRVSSPQAYLTGLAHPSAFEDASNEQVSAMLRGANRMQAACLPPVVKLRVIEDTYTAERERLFDTPASIARIFRGPEFKKRLVVTAEDSFDPNNLPITYLWSVLRGNGVVIRKVNSSGSIVEITVPYHPETTIEGSTRLTNRIDVGAFVKNSCWVSAPAFVTSFTLANEDRTYNVQSEKLISKTTNSKYVHPYLK